MSWIWTGIGLMLALPAFIALGMAGLFVYLRVYYLRYMRRIFQETPFFIIPRGQPHPDAEDVSIPTSDGLTLRACYIKTTAPRRGVVWFGLEFGSNRWSCRMYCDHLLAAGYDVFACEFRNQGDSDRDPNYDPLPWLCEKDIADARAAYSYLRNRLDAPPEGVGLFGISKGAAAGLVVAGDDPSIRCCVTDGVFGVFSTTIPYMKRWISIYSKRYLLQGLMPTWFYRLLGGIAIQQVERERGVRYVRVTPALKKLHRPLLMIHGEQDSYIKPYIAIDLCKRASEPKELWLIPDAKHNMGLHVAGDEYRARVLAFFDCHLATSPRLPCSAN